MILAEEVVEFSGAPEEDVQGRWLGALRRHIFGSRRWLPHGEPPRVLVAEPLKFRGRTRFGRLGALDFCLLQMEAHVFVDGAVAPVLGHGHLVFLQLDGTSVCDTGRGVVRLRPGSLLLLKESSAVRWEHQSHVDQIVLLNPLAAADINALFAALPVRCEGHGEMERLAFRWIADACLGASVDAAEVAHDVAHTLSRLLAHVLRQRHATPLAAIGPRITREHIEHYIEMNLADPGLDAMSIARAFTCSVRTLHRAFQSIEGESLARYLWRMRVEACAAELRRPGAAALSLTELAMRWGFASPAHFSKLFRTVHDASPTEYRRRHLQTG